MSLSKPKWAVFLKQAIAEISILGSDGFRLLIDNVEYTIKVRVLCSVFDLVARVSIWNVVQFNGEYGCTDCMHPGISLRRGVRIWPYFQEMPEKTLEWYEKAICQSELLKKTIMGVKGPSILSSVLDLSSQCPIDFMHQTYEGVFKNVLKNIFEDSKRSWYLGNPSVKSQIDKTLQDIRWPHAFHRKIPSLSSIGQFKASEFRNALLYAIVLVNCLRFLKLDTIFCKRFLI